jgi:hypothetical protein
LPVDAASAGVDVLRMSDTGRVSGNFDARQTEAEALGAFLLAPVPRREIPGVIRRATGGVKMWLGVFSFGAIFVLLGSVFAFAFFPYGFWKDWKLDRAHSEVTGRVTSVRKTNMSTNNIPVCRYEFEFRPEGLTGGMQGVCYTTGFRWRESESVQVWHLPGDGAVARIEGARTSKAPASGILFLFFPAAGFGILLYALVARGSLQWLLVNGLVGEFRVERIVDTRERINKQPRYRAECRRLDDATDEACYCYSSHVRGKVAFMEELRRSGRTVFALYDPRERGKKRRRVELPEAWFR